MNKTKKASAIERINEMVIAGLQRDGLSWFRPWGGTAASHHTPLRRVDNKPYHGFNVFLLNAVMAEQGFRHNEWLTFAGAQKLGGRVISGPGSSTPVFYWKVSFYDDRLDVAARTYYPSLAVARSNGVPPQHIAKSFYMKTSAVFNIDQVEGVDALRPALDEEPAAPVSGTDACDVARAVVDGWAGAPPISHYGNAAFYSPAKDAVVMPPMDVFVDCDSYYKTLFHELGHATGHAKRLSRPGIVKPAGFGSDPYAKEELVAEIASAYMVGLTGLSPKDDGENTQAYINGWVKRIRGSKGREQGFVVSAMTQAYAAVEMMTADSEVAVSL